MSAIRELPEIAGLDGRQAMLRIPAEIDVPLTPRVRQLIDTAEFRRLARISQLGLVSLVYPAAIHTRFEHSLGVYRLALLYLAAVVARRAVRRPSSRRTTPSCSSPPRCCTTWDIGRSAIRSKTSGCRACPSHELFANSFLLEGEIADVLRDDWGINPRDVVALLSRKAPRRQAAGILASMLSGPIDIDKMDYLSRDSLHAGVPYGRNFDQQRLIGSLCLNAAGRRAGDHRQRQDGRRDDGLRPLRDVQRGLLASRRPRGHGHAAAGVLPAARQLDLDACSA